MRKQLFVLLAALAAVLCTNVAAQGETWDHHLGLYLAATQDQELWQQSAKPNWLKPGVQLWIMEGDGGWWKVFRLYVRGAQWVRVAQAGQDGVCPQRTVTEIDGICFVKITAPTPKSSAK